MTGLRDVAVATEIRQPAETDHKQLEESHGISLIRSSHGLTGLGRSVEPLDEHVLVSVNPAAQLVFARRRQARQIAHLLPAERRRSQRQTVNLRKPKKKTTFVQLSQTDSCL